MRGSLNCCTHVHAHESCKRLTAHCTAMPAKLAIRIASLLWPRQPLVAEFVRTKYGPIHHKGTPKGGAQPAEEDARALCSVAVHRAAPPACAGGAGATGTSLQTCVLLSSGVGCERGGARTDAQWGEHCADTNNWTCAWTNSAAGPHSAPLSCPSNASQPACPPE